MTKHLTVRMAWHDNNWNGKVCNNPEENYYCVGDNSLLSRRLRENRDLEIEKRNPNNKADKIPDYLPPCFWSINAFSNNKLSVIHKLPFNPKGATFHPIEMEMEPYSVCSWPFRLVFTHSKEVKEIEGEYQPFLKNRAENFKNLFKSNHSIIFFYLNYDNPISGDDLFPHYVLLGCALLKNIGDLREYKYEPGNAVEIVRNSGKNAKKKKK